MLRFAEVVHACLFSQSASSDASSVSHFRLLVAVCSVWFALCQGFIVSAGGRVVVLLHQPIHTVSCMSSRAKKMARLLRVCFQDNHSRRRQPRSSHIPRNRESPCKEMPCTTLTDTSGKLRFSLVPNLLRLGLYSYDAFAFDFLTVWRGCQSEVRRSTWSGTR